MDEFPCPQEAKLYALSEARLHEADRQAEQVRVTVGEVRDRQVDPLGRWARAVPARWSWRDGED